MHEFESGFDPKEKSAVSEEAEHWSLTTLREKLIRIGARMVRHGRYVTFQMAEVAVSGRMFGQILAHVARLRAPPVRGPSIGDAAPGADDQNIQH